MGGPGSGRRPSGRAPRTSGGKLATPRKSRKVTSKGIKKMNHVTRRINRETSSLGGLGGRTGKGVGIMKMVRNERNKMFGMPKRRP